MFQAGYANFDYPYKVGDSYSQRATEVACGKSYIEFVLTEGLNAFGLELPNGELTIDKEKNEISIYRSLLLPQKNLSVEYSRIYPPQYGFDRMIKRMARELREAHEDPDITDMSLSDLFKEYLIRNMCFAEKTVFNRNIFPETWVEGKVKFNPTANYGIPEKCAEYSIGLSSSFIEDISEECQANNGKSLSTRRRNILSNRQEPLDIDKFLRAVDIRPSTIVEENLKKYNLFITNMLFRDLI